MAGQCQGINCIHDLFGYRSDTYTVFRITFEPHWLADRHAVGSAQVPVTGLGYSVKFRDKSPGSLALEINSNRDNWHTRQQSQPGCPTAGWQGSTLARAEIAFREDGDRFTVVELLFGGIENSMRVFRKDWYVAGVSQYSTEEGCLKCMFDDQYAQRLREKRPQVKRIGGAGMVGTMSLGPAGI